MNHGDAHAANLAICAIISPVQLALGTGAILNKSGPVQITRAVSLSG
jgi:hypothetical protein